MASNMGKAMKDAGLTRIVEEEGPKVQQEFLSGLAPKITATPVATCEVADEAMRAYVKAKLEKKQTPWMEDPRNPTLILAKVESGMMPLSFFGKQEAMHLGIEVQQPSENKMFVELYVRSKDGLKALNFFPLGYGRLFRNVHIGRKIVVVGGAPDGRWFVYEQSSEPAGRDIAISAPKVFYGDEEVIPDAWSAFKPQIEDAIARARGG